MWVFTKNQVRVMNLMHLYQESGKWMRLSDLIQRTTYDEHTGVTKRELEELVELELVDYRDVDLYRIRFWEADRALEDYVEREYE